MLLDNWYQQAVSRYTALLELLETVFRYPIPQPTGSYESLVEFDRQRMIKDSLLEQIVATCVETADAGRAGRSSASGCRGSSGRRCCWRESSRRRKAGASGSRVDPHWCGE